MTIEVRVGTKVAVNTVYPDCPELNESYPAQITKIRNGGKIVIVKRLDRMDYDNNTEKFTLRAASKKHERPIYMRQNNDRLGNKMDFLTINDDVPAIN